jgi:hypothetical protein
VESLVAEQLQPVSMGTWGQEFGGALGDPGRAVASHKTSVIQEEPHHVQIPRAKAATQEKVVPQAAI